VIESSSTILGIFEPKPFEEIPDDDWRRFLKSMCSAECD